MSTTNTPLNSLTMEEKIQKEKIINSIWRHMVEGFQNVDPLLATKWGANKPSGGVSSTTGNPLLSMYCRNHSLSIIVEYNEATRLYLLSTCADGTEDIKPLTTVMAPEAIAPSIIEFLQTK